MADASIPRLPGAKTNNRRPETGLSFFYRFMCRGSRVGSGNERGRRKKEGGKKQNTFLQSNTAVGQLSVLLSMDRLGVKAGFEFALHARRVFLVRRWPAGCHAARTVLCSPQDLKGLIYGPLFNQLPAPPPTQSHFLCPGGPLKKPSAVTQRVKSRLRGHPLMDIATPLVSFGINKDALRGSGTACDQEEDKIPIMEDDKSETSKTGD